MKHNKRIGNLTEEQLLDLISNSLKKNRITLGCVEIESSNSNLKEIEIIVNRLLEKHQDFLLMNRLNKITLRE